MAVMPGEETVLRVLREALEDRGLKATITTRLPLSLVVVRHDSAALGGRITVRPWQGEQWLWRSWGAPIVPAEEIKAASWQIARALAPPAVSPLSHRTASPGPLIRLGTSS